MAGKSSFNVNISSDKKAAIAEILRLGTSADWSTLSLVL